MPSTPGSRPTACLQGADFLQSQQPAHRSTHHPPTNLVAIARPFFPPLPLLQHPASHHIPSAGGRSTAVPVTLPHGSYLLLTPLRHRGTFLPPPGHHIQNIYPCGLSPAYRPFLSPFTSATYHRRQVQSRPQASLLSNKRIVSRSRPCDTPAARRSLPTALRG